MIEFEATDIMEIVVIDGEKATHMSEADMKQIMELLYFRIFRS